ncbi:aspartate aminotransferase family protein [Flavobacteriaceae bacterium]|uniref:aspartate aminotransferase family protein n=1 Tax=Candidatus Arcticimaribacter forsetii TaxID=2820661 RepID=UPI00207773FA|nr:aspartate aminotransferase family protein [Candidatus Arcticimaribacter forsetii]MDA8699058.1 aspartate aminotransferase family protein [Flavobacteriaceae bacterium]MDB4674919.1 aspartate aminotransferase family protein [Flavobacteriaceae bacterium]
MKTLHRDFLTYQAKTTPYPLGIEIDHAKGSYVYDSSGKSYLDFVAGVSACSLGHCHPNIVEAIKNQSERYLHVMVYGEFAQEPAVNLAKELAQELPESLGVTYLVNSGTEAIEGALKLAKRVTGRGELISANKAYHGSTHGALSLLGAEEQKKAYRPLLPGVSFIEFNDEKDLKKITSKTAAVLLETIQGGAGFILPENNYLRQVKKRCEEVGALLILDEIQPGFGRTGSLFGFQQFDVVPDILVMGKGMGGGLPIGAFSSSSDKMMQLTENPKLGHITTFGGNPLVAASALATLRTLKSEKLIEQVKEKENLFRSLLKHPAIKQINGTGLMLAPLFENEEIANKVVLGCMEKGLILFWLLWEKKAVRISPPLTISEEEIKKGCAIINEVLEGINS